MMIFAHKLVVIHAFVHGRTMVRSASRLGRLSRKLFLLLQGLGSLFSSWAWCFQLLRVWLASSFVFGAASRGPSPPSSSSKFQHLQQGPTQWVCPSNSLWELTPRVLRTSSHMLPKGYPSRESCSLLLRPLNQLSRQWRPKRSNL
mmetsp:Transcript_94829/g.163661  ORF Transcript_94829/g.163661 Transcript_94829/m.163661 type:complete len:145 (+) Transcript_94829:195-629(+)